MNSHLSQAQPVAFRSFTPAEVEELATACLSSPDYDERMRAQDALRPLSHFEQWDRMRDLFLATENQYAIFVLVKATLHIVTNEVVPHERIAIMSFINGYCAGNPTLSDGSIGMLMRVTATCIFLNWRSMILTYDGPRLADMLRTAQADTPLAQVIAMEASQGGGNDDDGGQQQQPNLGAKVMDELHLSLQGVSHLMLVAALETVHHFTAEEKHSATRLIHETFVAFLLPRFFALAVEHLASEVHFEGALRLCAACLELPPPESLRSMVELTTTDEVLHFAPMEHWFGLFVTALSHVSQRLETFFLASAPEEAGDAVTIEDCLRVASLISQVQFVDVPVMLLTNMVGALIAIGMKCMMNFPRFEEMESLCHHGASIIINVLERHPNEAMTVFESEPAHTYALASLVSMVSMDWARVDDQAKGSLLMVVALILESTTAPSAFESAQVAVSQKIFSTLAEAFEGYLTAVIANCHLSEADDDIHCPEALELSNDALLRPVAVVLLSCEGHFGSVISRLFADSIAAHEACETVKRGYGVTTNASDSLMQLLATVSIDDVTEDTFALVASRVALSRISVVINIISLWLQNRGKRQLFLEDTMDDYVMLSSVASFAKGFFTDDIADLLMCMDVTGVKRGGGSATLHVGIMRSLLYFASAVATSAFAEQEATFQAASSIMQFVLTQHSLDAPVLAADSIGVLNAFTSGPDGGNQGFTGSAECGRLIAAHLAGDIALTTSAGVVAAASSNGNAKSAGGRLMSLRKHLFRCFARLVDRRYTFGQTTDRSEHYRLLDTISAPLFDEQLLQRVGTVPVVEVFFSDVRGIAKVVQSPLLLLAVMQWVMNLKSRLVDFLSAHTCLSLSATKTWSKLARQFREELTEDLMSPLPPTFCSFVFDSVDFLLLQRATDYGPNYELSVPEQGSIAVLLNSVLRGTWCNVAVMIFYGDINIPRVLLCALRKFITSPPAEVMSLKNRVALFQTITAAFRVKEATIAVRDAPDYVRLCEDLASFLVACVRVNVIMELLEAINVTFAPASVAIACTPIVVDLFRELAIILSTNAAPNSEEGVPIVCVVLHRLYRHAPDATAEVLEMLLTQASAWHRVRLRSLLLMLHNNPTDLAAQFLNTFGASANREQIISAW